MVLNGAFSFLVHNFGCIIAYKLFRDRRCLFSIGVCFYPYFIRYQNNLVKDK
jgi:hypothetical protein